MAKATIPITDHDTGSPMICTQYYIVEYRPTGVSGWSTASPNITAPPIVLEDLVDNISYDLKVTRVCCNGAKSTPTTTTFIATP